MPRANRRRRGFSLVELMVVVTILGILAAIVIANIGGSADIARQKAAATQIAAFGGAVQTYHTTHGKYPGSLDELTKPDPKYNNQYYIKSIPTDPWGNKFRYEKTSSGYKISSRGADGASGGTGINADVTSDNLDQFK